VWAAPVCGMAKEKICKRGTYRPKETARAAALQQQPSNIHIHTKLPLYYAFSTHEDNKFLLKTGHYLVLNT